ncbi:MAG TPA: AMP-binding protein, partial [Kineosporiaceae bacterium]|nr:AMP-binding protein [Kineosporiaceae bacterium]
PRPERFNYARDWFDAVAAGEARDRPALWIVEPDGSELKLSYAELAARSRRLAAWLAEQGVRRGDRLLLMLGNQVELWETVLAAIRLGAVIIPATTLLSASDVRDRIERGHVRHVVARASDAGVFEQAGDVTRIAVGGSPQGWLAYTDAEGFGGEFDGEDTAGDETLLLYFTSGTTASPKLVEHTHTSYPIGHLSTMYWIGLRPGDVHVNVSSPGWAKHAWSSLFAPWNAEATVTVINQARFDGAALLEALERVGVTTFCAPPTVWRMLVQQDLAAWAGRLPLREVVAAGEPLNPEVIEHVRRVWGLVVRDGFGQTETTAQVGNAPAQPVVVGSMGRPLPGYDVVLVDPVSDEIRAEGPAEGELCLRLDSPELGRPLGLMVGYRDDPDRTAEAMRSGVYHTGDVAARDADGYITYIGRSDDVFKASDYRISPFELESVLVEHPAVAEAAVVPSPDPLRLSVPKAFVVLATGWEPTAATAKDILDHCREHLAPYKRIRRLEFAELPKTISGKIRRVELRDSEHVRHPDGGGERAALEFWEDDLH